MPTDKQLVSEKQKHEIAYLLKKWKISRKELLEIKGRKRSRKVIEKELRAFGYHLKSENFVDDHKGTNEV